MFELVTLSLLIFVAAALYSSVGHGGASGYLAVMALFSVAPDVMRPAALVLNVLVASIGTVRFAREGYFSWRTFWPFAVASIPLAFIGGTITLPGTLYKQLLGVVLVFAAFRLLLYKQTGSITSKPVPIAPAMLSGGAIGLLSGLTGVGGGIFLTPLLLLTRWSETRQASGISAAFILVNSIAGLLGQFSRLQLLPGEAAIWALAAVVGGLIGTELGARRFNSLVMRRLLAVVLLIAAFKLIFT
jgi:hypothetical protein